MALRLHAGAGEGVEVRLMLEGESCSCKTITPLLEQKIFQGKLGEVYTVHHKNRVYIGLGKREKLDRENMRKAFFALGKELQRIKAVSAYTYLERLVEGCLGKTVRAMAEGLLQSEYVFDKYLSEKKDAPCLQDFYFHAPEGKEEKISSKLAELPALMEGLFFARDLANEPAMEMTPAALAQACRDRLVPLGVEVEVLEKAQIEELGMKAFLAVARGSAQEPRFILMRWNGGGPDGEKTAVVGKGLTYDSGGYCIKPPESMLTMNHDMAGAAAVAGLMLALAKNKVEKNVVGLVAACENMISGDAYKTGDIIGSMKGLTIEVGNTDAEGRLTLADALYYAATVEKPGRILDCATLTGACVVALGGHVSGLVSNDEGLAALVERAGSRTGDMVWRLPVMDLYRDMVKGTMADLKNVSKGGAGAITAGMFLERFVEDIPWAHIDIAGPAYLDKAHGYQPLGATGAPLRLLYELIKDVEDEC